MTWCRGLPAGKEALKCRWDVVPFTRGRGLEIGCGERKLFPHFIGIDNGRDARLFGAAVCPDIVAEATDLSQFSDGSMDFVFSSHTLEHIEDYQKALAEWWRLVKVGGHMVLYLPHADFYPRKGSEDANPDHAHDFLPDDILNAMRSIGMFNLMVNEERDQGDEYSFLQVYEKRVFEQMLSWANPRPAKTCAIARYGAWGDGIQMTSILPGLKEQGFHITLYTTPQCHEVLKCEPLIDKVVLQDHDQVSNNLPTEYWAYLRTKYDRFINLSESVEANFLATPERVNYHWPKEARHELMNRNYGEMLHAIAGVPYDGLKSRFVESDAEGTWAAGEVERISGDPLILWVIAGSSVHKLWGHVDQLFGMVLKHFPQAKIVTVGDEKCKLIEKPWMDNPQIVCRSGVWSIRDTLAFAKRCDLVIGPETGVLNAVSMEQTPKIVFLSHSTDENLTRDWVNVYPIWSETTACYPCHKMIHSWDQCVRHESGTAQCMSDISADEVWQAVWWTLKHKELEAA